MTFATSSFGNGVLTGSGGNVTSNVHNHYGPRKSGNVVGVLETDGAYHELSIEFDGDIVTAGAWPLMAPTLPAGALIKDVTILVDEVFALGGTTPVVDIGTEGSEATNGFTMTEANLETAQTVDLTSALSGTWAAPLAAATTVGILLGGGGSNTSTSAGVGKVIIRYVKVPA